MTRNDAPVATMSWAVPGVAAVIGLGYLVAGVVGDDLGFGVFGLLLMVGFAAALMLVRRKSETVAGLMDRRDERMRSIDNDATLFAGAVLIVAVIAGFIIEVARGHDGSPYYVLGAIAGIAYVGAVIVLRLRR